MYFEWNEVKRRSNIRRHGIDFVNVEDVLPVKRLPFSMIDMITVRRDFLPSACFGER
jgi:hypothetical protein